MKYNDFKKFMKKPMFSTREAQILAFQSSPEQVNLQLHQWAERGELVHLCRGYYSFPDQITDQTEIIKYLYPPAYMSLESAMHHYGFIPDVPFGLTLVTTRITRHFQTPFGHFYYHRIHPKFFWGYDEKSSLGEKEKILLDYCYLNSARLESEFKFWKEFRLQNLEGLNFQKLTTSAKRFHSKKILQLAHSIQEYAKHD